MALKLIGFDNIENGKFFPIEEANRFAIEYMEKNQDQFARRFDGLAAPGSGGAQVESIPSEPVLIWNAEELGAMKLPALKKICADRGLSIGDELKDGIVALILADQGNKE